MVILNVVDSYTQTLLPDLDIKTPTRSITAEIIKGVQLALLTAMSAPKILNDSESPAA